MSIVTLDRLDLANLLEGCRHAARAAAGPILEVYEDGCAVHHKDDASPVTEADLRAERVILAALAELAPDIPVVAEEECAARGVPGAVPGRFWLVDPLDGTKEFISGNGEFTVNIALIEHGCPTLGVVHVPVTGGTSPSAGISAA